MDLCLSEQCQEIVVELMMLRLALPFHASAFLAAK